MTAVAELARRMEALEAAHAELNARYTSLLNSENARWAFERRRQKKLRLKSEHRLRALGKDQPLSSIDTDPKLYGMPDTPVSFASKGGFSILPPATRRRDPVQPPPGVRVPTQRGLDIRGASDELKNALVAHLPGAPALPPTRARQSQLNARRTLRQCVRDVLHKMRAERRNRAYATARVAAGFRPDPAHSYLQIAGLYSDTGYGEYGNKDQYISRCVIPRLDYIYEHDDPDQFPHSYCYVHLIHPKDRFDFLSPRGTFDKSLGICTAAVANMLQRARPSPMFCRMYIMPDGNMHVSNSHLPEMPWVPIWPPQFIADLNEWYRVVGQSPNKKNGHTLFYRCQQVATQLGLWEIEKQYASRATHGRGITTPRTTLPAVTGPQPFLLENSR